MNPATDRNWPNIQMNTCRAHPLLHTFNCVVVYMPGWFIVTVERLHHPAAAFFMILASSWCGVDLAMFFRGSMLFMDRAPPGMFLCTADHTHSVVGRVETGVDERSKRMRRDIWYTRRETSCKWDVHRYSVLNNVAMKHGFYRSLSIYKYISLILVCHPV